MLVVVRRDWVHGVYRGDGGVREKYRERTEKQGLREIGKDGGLLLEHPLFQMPS